MPVDTLSVVGSEFHKVPVLQLWHLLKKAGFFLLPFKMSVSRSEIDGSRDGSPTFFEVPLSATKCPRLKSICIQTTYSSCF